MQTITIYSTPSCHYCNLAKDYFKSRNIQYTEYNVATDLERRSEMVEMTGQMGVPVIKIGDAVMVGFNQEAIANMIQSLPKEELVATVAAQMPILDTVDTASQKVEAKATGMVEQTEDGIMGTIKGGIKKLFS